MDSVQPIFVLPQDHFAEDVLIPGFQVAEKVDCMTGFFSSQVLASLAPGLATYISRSEYSFRLIISPILSREDRIAIENGLQTVDEVTTSILGNLFITEDLLVNHTLKCLTWLLRQSQIEIKIALMKDALFHPKAWMFKCGDDVVVAHGSSNATAAGLSKNIELIAISRSWQDTTQVSIVDRINAQFDQLWNDHDDNCIVISMPDAVKQCLLRDFSSENPPNENTLRKLFRSAAKFRETKDSEEPIQPHLSQPEFKIPNYLNYKKGPYKHQGEAVNSWCDAGFKGILEMATGSGKTITAMLCSYRVFEQQKPLLIVVAAPYRPLIQQWCEEIVNFGLQPVNMTEFGPQGRQKKLELINRRLRLRIREVEVIVISHITISDQEFNTNLEKLECKKLLIADEVHNLGAEGFISHPPSYFEYRLGLSATPVRQYDEIGTTSLFDYFGAIVYTFSLNEAIGQCLVEYDYYIHPVELTADEMDDWYELTAKIKSNAWRLEKNEPNEFLSKLLRDRRRILEIAKNKLNALEDAFDRENLKKLRHTLIYASDKAPQQLELINQFLVSRNLLFHQLTHIESSNREKTAEIIRSFQEGTLQVLTAKRVLDEGVNIPQIRKAFILASTTVERQWIQRRGRLLRTCREIGKTHSEIHDFVTLPPELNEVDHDAKKLIRSELLRVQEFAKLARNAGRPDGPIEVIHKLVKVAFL